MECKELLSYLRQHKEELIESIRNGKYKPNPVCRVEIPKDNGKKRLLGIPTVVERLIQQAIVQVLSTIAKRVCTSVTKFVEKELHLSVNRDKTEVGYIRGMKYLGYSFYFAKGKCRLCVHKKTKDKLKRKLKPLTGRSNGMGYARRKELLWQTFGGWLEYLKYADMKTMLNPLGQWYRRRLRMCIWKCWKSLRTRVKNLIKCGLPEWHAYITGAIHVVRAEK